MIPMQLLDVASSLPPTFASMPTALLYCGDALDILNALPPSSVDCIFADPPYNLSNDGSTCYAGKRVSVNKGTWDKSRGFENDFLFHSQWIQACKKLLKPHGTLWISGTYHSIFSCGYALQTNHWHILNDIIWYKSNAAPNLACRMFTASHETLLWARPEKKGKHYFDYEAMKCGDFEKDALKKSGKQMRTVWSIGLPQKSEKLYGKHPTQKPVALLDRIIKASCPQGSIVLDPFCGSGTTGVAALHLNHFFIGIDTEKTYLEKLVMPRLADISRERTHGT